MGIEKRRSTLSVLFYIKRQKLLKNGEAPVCMRITVDKRKAEIVIKRSVPVELWNQSKECSKGKDRRSQELNHYINSVRARVLQIHRELEIDNKVVTADIIRDRQIREETSERIHKRRKNKENGNITGSVKLGKPPARKYGLSVWPNLFGRTDKTFFPVCLLWVMACAIHGRAVTYSFPLPAQRNGYKKNLQKICKSTSVA